MTTTPQELEAMVAMSDRVLGQLHGRTGSALTSSPVDPPASSAAQASDLERALGVLGYRESAAIQAQANPVQTAPPIPQTPAVPPPSLAGVSAALTVDDAVGAPGGVAPAGALRTSDFAQRLFRATGGLQTLGGQGIIGGSGYTTPALGSVLVVGTIAQSGTPTSLTYSTDGGVTYSALAAAYTVGAGQSFTFGQVVDANVQLNVATTASTVLQELMVVFVPGLVVNQTQASQVTIDGNVTAVISGPVEVTTGPGTTLDISGPVQIDTSTLPAQDYPVFTTNMVESPTVQLRVNLPAGQAVTLLPLVLPAAVYDSFYVSAQSAAGRLGEYTFRLGGVGLVDQVGNVFGSAAPVGVPSPLPVYSSPDPYHALLGSVSLGGPLPLSQLTLTVESADLELDTLTLTVYAHMATVTVGNAIQIDGSVTAVVDGPVTIVTGANTPIGANITNSPAVNPALDATLSAALVSGDPYTALAVTATTTSTPKGTALTLVLGTNTQDVTTSQAVPAGATSIAVGSFTANFAYPIGTVVVAAIAIAGQVATTTTPTAIGSVAANTAVAANTDLIATYTVPTGAAGMVSVSVCLASTAAAAVISIVKNGQVCQTLLGQALQPGMLYDLFTQVIAGDTVNVQVATATTLDYFAVLFTASL